MLLGLVLHKSLDLLSKALHLRVQALQNIILSNLKRTLIIELTFFICIFLTIILDSTMCAHVRLDPSPSLQVCELLAYHCHSCALKSCRIEQLRETKAQLSFPECSICVK